MDSSTGVFVVFFSSEFFQTRRKSKFQKKLLNNSERIFIFCHIHIHYIHVMLPTQKNSQKTKLSSTYGTAIVNKTQKCMKSNMPNPKL